MQLRLRQIPKPVSFATAWLIVMLLVWIILYLVRASLGAPSPLKSYLDSNAAVEVGLAILLALVAGAFSLRKGFAIPALICCDGRKTLRRDELHQMFTADASTSATADAGWQMTGGGRYAESAATYQAGVFQLFSISAEFKPIRIVAANHYWRVGFAFFRPDGSRPVTIHVDSHNLIVGLLNDQFHLRVPVSTQLEGRWSLLEADLSTGDAPNAVRVFCHLNGLSWFVGAVEPMEYPWSVRITAWSDQHRHHSVLVRDVAVAHNLA